MSSITTRYFYSAALQRRIDCVIEEHAIDAVFCSSSPMAEYVFRSRHAERLLAGPSVMDLIDVDSVKWQHYAEESPFWSAWLYRREARCLAELERRIGRAFQHVLVVTEAEKACYPGADKTRVLAVGNGVDLEHFAPRHAATCDDKDDGPMLVFTGVMDYRPNVEGVDWFAREILPRVRAAVANARFFIVGNRPTKAVQRLEALPGVAVTGFVPEVTDYLACAAVCVAPLRLARGVQNKVLEAMAMGQPVVTTPQAFEGIDAEAGRDLLVAGDAAGFADAVIGLLRDPARAEKLGRAGRALMEARYSWERNLAVLDRLVTSSPGDFARDEATNGGTHDSREGGSGSIGETLAEPMARAL